MPLLIELFNLVLEKNIIPDSWLTGIIKPIYKKKGDISDPNNYRPITILSCLGKLFTKILNNRLSNFLEENDILTPAQAGFRKSFSTTDNLFVIYNLMQILHSRKQKLYCAFIDFTKAFDTVWRVGLWLKMQNIGIEGRFLTLVKAMYSGIKSLVQVNNNESEYFSCDTGVRQGENLSPLLFSIFVNDIEEHLLASDCNGIKLNYSEDYASQLFLQLLILLYADDAVLFGESPQELQKALDSFKTYCITWKLTVNTNKTKILVFGSGPSASSKLKFYYNNKRLDIVDTYSYLGITFHRNKRLVTCIKELAESATKAMFSLLKKSRNIDLPLDCQLIAFDAMILPILVYGCEIWCFENIEGLEKIHLKFLRLITGLRNSTPRFMLYGELGRFPITINIHKRLISFWHKLTYQIGANKLSHCLFNYLISDVKSEQNPWLLKVKDILDSTGLSYVFNNPSLCTTQWLVSRVEQNLKDQFIQEWRNNISSSSKGFYYQLFKPIPLFDKYLTFPKRIYIPLLRFITCNHNLPVETGRWENIPRSDRTCKLCKSPAIADELHYVLYCNALSEFRNFYLPYLVNYHPTVHILVKVFSCKNSNVIVNLSKFIAKVLYLTKNVKS